MGRSWLGRGDGGRRVGWRFLRKGKICIKTWIIVIISGYNSTTERFIELKRVQYNCSMEYHGGIVKEEKLEVNRGRWLKVLQVMFFYF